MHTSIKPVEISMRNCYKKTSTEKHNLNNPQSSTKTATIILKY